MVRQSRQVISNRLVGHCPGPTTDVQERVHFTLRAILEVAQDAPSTVNIAVLYDVVAAASPAVRQRGNERECERIRECVDLTAAMKNTRFFAQDHRGVSPRVHISDH